MSKNIKVKKKKWSQPWDPGLLGVPYYIRQVY